MGLRERALNVVLDVVSAQPALEASRRLSAARGRAWAWARQRRQRFFEEAGVATAADLARVESSLFEVLEESRALSADLARLAARLAPEAPRGDEVEP